MGIDKNCRKEKFGIKLIKLIGCGIISILLFGIANLFHGFGWVFYFLSTVPVIYLIVFYGYELAGIHLLLTYIGLYFILGKMQGVLFLLVFGTTGFFLGYAVKRKYPSVKVVIYSAVLCVIMFVFFGIVAIYFLNYNIFSSTIYAVKAYNNQIIEFYKKLDVPPEDLKNILLFLKGKMDLIEKVFFSIVVLGCFFGIFIVYKIMLAFFSKKGCSFESLPLFSSWRPAEKLVFGFIFAASSFWFGFYAKFELIKIFGQNMLVIFGAIYFISGLSLLNYFCKVHNIKKIMRYLLYMLAVLQPVFIFSFGLVDVWADFRKKIQRSKIKI